MYFILRFGSKPYTIYNVDKHMLFMTIQKHAQCFSLFNNSKYLTLHSKVSSLYNLLTYIGKVG